MATITSLPEELIPIILGYKDITIEDIINFRCTCRQFRYAGNYPKYMEKKFSQRWPSLKKYCDILFKTNKNHEKYDSLTYYLHLIYSNYNHKECKSKKQIMNFIELGISYTRTLRKYVFRTRYTHYHNNKSIDNFMNFNHIFRYLHNHSNIHNYEAVIYYGQRFSIFTFFDDELKNLLTHSPRRTGCDLTERYYYEKLFHTMRKCNLYLELDKFDGVGDRLRLMERTAFNVAQTIQIQKDVSYVYVVESLDNIALEVQNYLKEKHPDHSIFSTSAGTFSYWKSNNIYDNHWNQAEGIQLIDALNEYMFGKLNFRPCRVNDTNLEYMCIDNVLKNRYGQEMILLIIYHCVARRLGLRSDIIKIPGRSNAIRCIYWKSRYGMINPENERCFSLTVNKFPDCLVNKLYHWESHHPVFKNSLLRESFDETARIRMRHELMLRVVDLTYHYNNTSQIKQRNKIYLFRNSHCKIKKLCLKKKWEFIRTEDVKFAVGMIVTHRDNKCRNCDGVIIGWDRHTDRRYEILTYNLPDAMFDGGSDRTIEIALNFLPFNHCHNYTFSKKQTNYIILTDNNKICYVNEDKLTLAEPKWIDNSEIGRYFCKFENTHYVPNKMLTKLYPEDDAIITQRTISLNPINKLTLRKRFTNVFRLILQ